MPSTNKTDKLKLSQFEPTDKPSFIQDYNADMAKIEQAMESAEINVVAPLKVSASAKASSNDSVALGTSAKATNDFSVALGSNASSAGTSVAVGGYASATSSSCVALGCSASTTANCSVALGTSTRAGEGSVALGSSAKAPNDNSVALGCHAEVANDNSVALGQGASTKRVSEVSIGNTNGDNSNGDLPRTRLLANVTDPELDQDAATKHYVDASIATKADATDLQALSTTVAGLPTTEQMQAITQAEVNVVAPLKLPFAASAADNTSVALGCNASATDSYSVAVGNNARTVKNNSVAVGNGADTTGKNSVAVGQLAKTVRNNSVAVGDSANAAGDYSVAVGQSASAANNTSVALGYGASTKRANEVSIGNTNGASSVPKTRFLANVTDPELDQDAATKHYVDSAVQNAIELIGQNVVNAPVHKLEDTATLADVISAYNELVTVLAAGSASQLTTE